MKLALIILAIILTLGFLILWYIGFWIGDKLIQMPR